MGQFGTTSGQLGAILDQLGTNLGEFWSNLEPTCPNLAQFGANMGLIWSQNDRLWAHLNPFWVKFGATVGPYIHISILYSPCSTIHMFLSPYSPIIPPWHIEFSCTGKHGRSNTICNHCPLPFANRPLHLAHCSLSTAISPLPVPSCPLHVVHCLARRNARSD